MTEKKLPLSSSELLDLVKKVGTPFNIYDGDEIEKNAEEMKAAFSWAPSFTNYFAVKALPNINILKLLGKHGFGADCSSLPELYMAKAAGIDYPLKWNSTGAECTEWEYSELLALSLSIAAYVAPKVAMQQAIELEIKATETMEQLDKVVIDYEG